MEGQLSFSIKKLNGDKALLQYIHALQGNAFSFGRHVMHLCPVFRQSQLAHRF
jgi:hypothetical protein